jgi:hypothetical protein
MITGVIVNNTGKSKHIFKRTVYPGQQVDLSEVHKLLSAKVPEGENFISWLQGYIPQGWEVHGEIVEQEQGKLEVGQGAGYEAPLPSVEETAENMAPSLQYLTPKKIHNMSAKDIFNLRVKDDPRKIVNQIDSIHKLRRALTLCNKSGRKEVLSKIIRARIDKLR